VEQKRGINEIGLLLAEHRKRAGFRSAAAAAAAFGWSASTLVAHESCRRRIGPFDAERYAAAFDEERRAFEDRDLAVRKLDELTRRPPAPGVSGPLPIDVGRRLALARRVRGFKRRAASCAAFGFPRPTLTAHELGASAIPHTQGSIYGRAYQISLDWLMKGVLPSGLGPRVDERLRSDPNPSGEEADELAALADEYIPPDRASLQAVTAFAVQGSGAAIREVVLHYEAATGFSELNGAPRLWALPEEYDRLLLGARGEDIVILPTGDGGRLFVDASDHAIVRRGRFLYVDAHSRPVIVAQPASEFSPSTSGLRLVGRILAEFTVFRDRA
jgi:hypothetical protein